MYRRSMRRVGRFAHRLRHRRMRVDRADQLLDRALETQRERRFGDELRRARTDHVDAEDLVVAFLRDDLHEPFRLARNPRAAEYAELERADLHVIAARLRLLLRQTDDRKSTRLNSSHLVISYAVFC